MKGPAGALAIFVALPAALAVGLLVGPGRLPPGEVLDALLDGPGAHHSRTAAIVWQLRVPRVLVAALVGAGLSVAGTVTQGYFRNPMAAPGVLGLGAGATLAATAGIALGLDATSHLAVPALAAAGTAAILALLMLLVRGGGDTATLLLSGIALSALASALSTLVLALASEQWDLARKVLAWLMGSFESRSYDHVVIAAVPVAAGSLLAWTFHRDLDVLVLGREAAVSLGVDDRRLSAAVVGAVGLLVGGATAAAGTIGFVGLLVPHVVRLSVGPRHGPLLLVSAPAGACVLVLVDAATRGLSPVPLPPGAVTSLVGAPVFLWLLLRNARGWIA